MDYSHVKVGVTILFKDEFPCKVVQVNVSSPGKHGHAKKACVGVDIFTQRKHEQIFTHHSRIAPVKTQRAPYTATYVDDDSYASLMDANGETREDLRWPADAAVWQDECPVVVLRAEWADAVHEVVLLK